MKGKRQCLKGSDDMDDNGDMDDNEDGIKKQRKTASLLSSMYWAQSSTSSWSSTSSTSPS